jgi:hypothetical protein
MADVTGGTPPTNASPFAVPADMTDIYDHFGDAAMFKVATVAALPASGNWAGRQLYVEADDGIYRWTGSAWRRNGLLAAEATRSTEFELGSAGVATAVPFDAVMSTLSGMWSGANPTRVVLPAVGLWEIIGHAVGELQDDNLMRAYIYLNGSQLLRSADMDTGNTGFNDPHLSPRCFVATTNTTSYVELRVSSDVGSQLLDADGMALTAKHLGARVV